VCVCVRVRVSPGDEQADLPHVHQLGPALHGSGADVRDEAGQRRAVLGGQDDQHADGVAVIRELDHLVLQALRGGGESWRRRRKS